MALFKILKGQEKNLPANKTEGWAYVTTDEGNMYVDVSASKRVRIGAHADKADVATKAEGDTESIRAKYLAKLKQVTSNGTTFTFRGETGDGSDAADLITIPLAGDKAGLISNAAQTIKGNKTFANGISFPTIGTWPTPANETYPIKSQGLSWSGSSDNAAIFYEVQASDKGMLVIESGDDTNAGLEIRNAASKKKVTIIDGLVTGAFKGNLTGTASYATSDVNGKNITSYIASVLAQSDNRTIRVTTGDGTTNDVKLYFAASSSFGGDANAAKSLRSLEQLDTQEKIDNFITGGLLQYATFKTTAQNNINFHANDGMLLSIPWDSSSDYGSQIAFDDNTTPAVKVRGKNKVWGAWKTVAFTDGTIENANYADKAKGDSTSIRTTYIASIKQVTSNGTIFSFRGYAGDGSEKSDLITIPNASASVAGLITNAAQTLGGNKTFTGDIYISHGTTATMTYNTTNPKLVFSENGGQPVGIVYTDYDSYRNPAGLKVMSTVSNNGKAWFEVEGSLYVGGDIYDKQNNILLASKYVAQLVGSQGNTNYTITPQNQNGSNLTNILNVPINLVGSANTNSKIFLVGTTSQSATAQTGYSHDTVYIDSDGFLYDSGNKPSYHSRVSIGNTNNYKWHRIARTNEIKNSWHDGTILLYISQDYNYGSYGLLRVSLRTNNISSRPDAYVEGEWIARSGFSLSNFKLALYSAANKVYADLYYISPGSYAGITVKQIQQGSRGSLNQNGWFLTNSSEANDTTASDKKASTSYKDITAAQTGLRGGVAYTSVQDTVDDSRVNNANYADRAQYDWNGNDIRKKYIATLAVKTTNGTTFTFKGSSMSGDELSAITIPAASASVAGLITNTTQTIAGTKTLQGNLIIKPGASDNYQEGLRICNANDGWTTLILGGTATSGTSASSWSLHTNGGNFYLAHNGSSSSSTGILQSDTNGNWQIKNRLGVNGQNVGYQFYVNGTSLHTNTINIDPNTVAIDFRYDHNSCHSTISYQTYGNEALVFANKYPYTSFLFVTNEDSITNHGSDRWQSLTNTGLQIKENCVQIGGLWGHNIHPDYKLKVNGTSYFTDFIRIPNNNSLIQDQRSTSNYTFIIEWRKGGGAGQSGFTYNPQVGQHNTGGADGSGSICVLPYATSINPWEGSVGLYICRGQANLDGHRLLTSHYAAIDSGVKLTSGYSWISIAGTSSFTCPDGTAITQPGGANPMVLYAGAASARDCGIFYLSNDNAYIANSSNNAYTFGVFDTDITQNFSTEGNASLCVRSNGAGTFIRSKLGVNGINDSYNLYVNGTSYFNGDISGVGNIYPLTNNGKNLGSSSLKWANIYATTFHGNLDGSADTLDGYHASQLWRSDGAVWNPGANVTCTGSSTEWSFDINSTGGNSYWHVWSSNQSRSILACYPESSHVAIPIHLYVGGYNHTGYALSTSSFICQSWIRTTEATGWYNETYGGGWYMSDSTYIRNYNSKTVRMDNVCLGADNNDYRLYVNGTSYFQGNVLIKNSDGNNYGGKLNFGDGDYVHLYEITDDCLEIKANNTWLTSNVVIGSGAGSTTKYSNYKLFVNGSAFIGGFIDLANSCLIKYGTISDAAYTDEALADDGNDGLCISQNGDETSGIQFNGDYITMWSPCDSYSLRYFDEDDGSELWHIDDAGYFSGTSKYSVTTQCIKANRLSPQFDQCLTYFSGQIPLGSSTGCAYAGSSNNILLWSFPSGNGDENGSVANIQVLRMSWGTTYWQEIFCSPNRQQLWYRAVTSGTANAWKKIWIEGNSVTGAVWNDYAECRKSDSQEPGYVMFEKGDDSLSKTIERLQHFAGIVSDTWGFSQGETAEAKTNIAVAGRVLAYPYRDRNEYKPGDCVCAAPGGKVDIMTREEIAQYPDRIVGTVSCVPDYEEWGGGELADRDPVKVNGRIWIKVR